MRKKQYVLLFSLAAMTAALITGCAGTDGKAAAAASAAQDTATAVTESETAAETAAETSASDAASSSDAGSSGESSEGKFGSFTCQTVDGKTVDDSIFANADVTMINMWATYCGPCINEMPDLGEISSEYADKKFQIIGIVTDVAEGDDTSGAKAVIDETGASYTHILLNSDLYNGYLQNVQAVPTTVFVDSNGNLIGDEYVGSKSKEDWETIIDGLLNQKN